MSTTIVATAEPADADTHDHSVKRSSKAHSRKSSALASSSSKSSPKNADKKSPKSSSTTALPSPGSKRSSKGTSKSSSHLSRDADGHLSAPILTTTAPVVASSTSENNKDNSSNERRSLQHQVDQLLSELEAQKEARARAENYTHALLDKIAKLEELVPTDNSQMPISADEPSDLSSVDLSSPTHNGSNSSPAQHQRSFAMSASSSSSSSPSSTNANPSMNSVLSSPSAAAASSSSSSSSSCTASSSSSSSFEDPATKSSQSPTTPNATTTLPTPTSSSSSSASTANTNPLRLALGTSKHERVLSELRRLLSARSSSRSPEFFSAGQFTITSLSALLLCSQRRLLLTDLFTVRTSPVPRSERLLTQRGGGGSGGGGSGGDSRLSGGTMYDMDAESEQVVVQVRLFLFSDLLVVGRRLNEHSDALSLELLIPLHGLLVWDLPPNECLPDSPHCFELARLDTKQCLVVVCASEAQKARWLRRLLTQSLLRFRRRK